jgi:hypothetical protein
MVYRDFLASPHAYTRIVLDQFTAASFQILSISYSSVMSPPDAETVVKQPMDQWKVSKYSSSNASFLRQVPNLNVTKRVSVGLYVILHFISKLNNQREDLHNDLKV